MKERRPGIPQMKRAIIIFTRVPIPGQTKTRMMPGLSAVQCARVHICFLRDIKRACEAVAADVFVCFTPEDKGQKLRKILGEQYEYFPQQGDTLGERMHSALEEVFVRGYEACILVGTDVPELKAEYMERAFWQLTQKEVVFGCTADGGYYLVGMKRLRREVFDIPQYGHKKVWEDTVNHLRGSDITIGYTEPLHDMDTMSDLSEYRERMRERPELQKTVTGRFLISTVKISVIVPVYNEERTIQGIQLQLRKLKNQCEILFVDGGSTDRTLELIDSEFTVIHSEKGRANQMNTGAEASTGDVLFFLHCDSELPAKPLTEIREVMKGHRAGCFGIRFRSRSILMHICSAISNHRIKDRKVMFGDQGIFVERGLFFSAGMFPNIPIMEDYQFSLNLKERRIRLGITKHRIYTSYRRFPKRIIPKLRLMWKMNRLRKMYRDGVEIQTIARMYQDVR